MESIREVYPNEEIYTADGQKADFKTTSLTLYDIIEAAEYDEGRVNIHVWSSKVPLDQSEKWGKGTTLQEAYDKANNRYWTYALLLTCVILLAIVLVMCLFIYLIKVSFKYMFSKKNTDLQEVADYIVDYEYKITKKMLLIFAKDNKFGVLNFKKKKIIIAPVYDNICWREQDILLYGEADGRKVLIDVYSGKELV